MNNYIKSLIESFDFNAIKKDSVHNRVHNVFQNFIKKEIKTVIDDMLSEKITKID